MEGRPIAKTFHIFLMYYYFFRLFTAQVCQGTRVADNVYETLKQKQKTPNNQMNLDLIQLIIIFLN